MADEQVRILIDSDPRKGIKGVSVFQQQSQKSFNKFEKGAQKSSEKALGFFKKFGLGISAALIARGAVRGFNTIIAKIDQIGKLSIRLGETTEFLSEMAFVAQRSGVSWQSLSVGIQRANRRIAEAAQGTGEAIKPLAELGLLQDVVNGRFQSFEAILPVLSDRLRNYGNDQDKLRIAFKLFDTEGVSFLQFLKEGAAGIAAVREQGKKFGSTITKDMTDTAAAAADSLTNMNTALDALGRDAALTAAGSVEILAIKLSELLSKVREIKKEGGIQFTIGRTRVTVGGQTGLRTFGGLFGNVGLSSEGGARNRDREAAEAEKGLRKFPGESQKDFKARVASKIAGFGGKTQVVEFKLTDDQLAEKLILQQAEILNKLNRAGVFDFGRQGLPQPGTAGALGAGSVTAARIRTGQRERARVDGLSARTIFIEERRKELIDEVTTSTRGWGVAMQGVESILQQIILDFENIDSFIESFSRSLISTAISAAFNQIGAPSSSVGLSPGDFLGSANGQPASQINIQTTREIDLDFFTRIMVPLQNRFVANGGTLRASTTNRI